MSKNLQIAFLLLCVYVCTGCVSASKQSVNTLNPILISKLLNSKFRNFAAILISGLFLKCSMTNSLNGIVYQ